MLEEAESAKFPRELEGGQDRVFARQGDQGRTGQGTVGVDPGARVAQGVLLPRGDALVAPAPAPDKKRRSSFVWAVKRLIKIGYVRHRHRRIIYPARLAQFYLKARCMEKGGGFFVSQYARRKHATKMKDGISAREFCVFFGPKCLRNG